MLSTLGSKGGTWWLTAMLRHTLPQVKGSSHTQTQTPPDQEPCDPFILKTWDFQNLKGISYLDNYTDCCKDGLLMRCLVSADVMYDITQTRDSPSPVPAQSQHPLKYPRAACGSDQQTQHMPVSCWTIPYQSSIDGRPGLSVTVNSIFELIVHSPKGPIKIPW